MRISRLIMLTCLLLPLSMTQAADNTLPWGHARLEQIKYKPNRVLYDVSVSSLRHFINILDRVSYLNTLYQANPFDASIILVLHGNEIPFFAVKNFKKYKALMKRAQSLTESGNIEFRMCKLAAEGQGFKPKDIHGFVTMVPMADAEIVRLQAEEHYAYMQ